jgi:hypothetical protein
MTEILIPKKNIILDSQIFTTLQACPRLSDFTFNHNLVTLDGKSNSLEVGSLVHKVMEVYNRSIINGIKRDEAIGHALIAGEIYIHGCKYCANFTSENGNKPECGHQPDEYPGLKNTPQVIDKNNPLEKYKVGWKWALETCEQYFDFWKNDSWIPLEVEITKGEILYEDDEIRILWKAKFDKIVDTNQGIYPIDYKTMKQNRDTLSLNNQFKGQCLLAKTRQIWIDKIGFQTTLEPKDKFKRVPISYSADQLLEWQSQELPFYAKMMLMYNEVGYWPPNYTHCENKYGKCLYYEDVCRADRGMREEELKLHFKVGKKWDIGDEE